MRSSRAPVRSSGGPRVPQDPPEEKYPEEPPVSVEELRRSVAALLREHRVPDVLGGNVVRWAREQVKSLHAPPEFPDLLRGRPVAKVAPSEHGLVAAALRRAGRIKLTPREEAYSNIVRTALHYRRMAQDRFTLARRAARLINISDTDTTQGYKHVMADRYQVAHKRFRWAFIRAYHTSHDFTDEELTRIKVSIKVDQMDETLKRYLETSRELGAHGATVERLKGELVHWHRTGVLASVRETAGELLPGALGLALRALSLGALWWWHSRGALGLELLLERLRGPAPGLFLVLETSGSGRGPGSRPEPRPAAPLPRPPVSGGGPIN